MSLRGVPTRQSFGIMNFEEWEREDGFPINIDSGLMFCNLKSIIQNLESSSNSTFSSDSPLNCNFQILPA